MGDKVTIHLTQTEVTMVILGLVIVEKTTNLKQVQLNQLSDLIERIKDAAMR